MRRVTVIAALLVAVVLLAGWLGGGFDALAQKGLALQREFQSALARAVRSLKADEPGAVTALAGLCFGYGVLHAAGPGHGKFLIGSYALANRIPVARVVAMTLAASLAQALMAVLVVYAGVLVFAWTLEQMIGPVEQMMAALSYAMIGLVGLYLAWRGWRMLTAATAPQPEAQHGHDHGHDHDHHHGHDHDHGQHQCAAGCGHAHGPTLDQIQQVGSLRDAALIIAGVALRPCTGAIFLLILCWRIGADAAGIAGALAMGLGTAVVTLIAALMATTMREGVWASGLDSTAMRRVAGGIGLTVGVILLGGAAMMLRPYF